MDDGTDCNPLHIYQQCMTGKQRLTTGTAALALMASLNIVTAPTMKISKKEAIASVVERKNQKKLDKKNSKKKKSGGRAESIDGSFGVSPDKETMDILLGMMKDEMNTLVQSGHDQISR